MDEFEDKEIEMADEELYDSVDFEEQFFERTQAGEEAQKFLSIASHRDCAIIRSLLSAENIPSYVENECMNNIYGGITGTMGALIAIRLYILCSDYEKAAEIVMDYIKKKAERVEEKKKGAREKLINSIGVFTTVLFGTPTLLTKPEKFLGITVFPKIEN